MTGRPGDPGDTAVPPVGPECPIRVGLSCIEASHSAVAGLCSRFAESACIVLPGFLGSDLHAQVHERVTAGRFEERVDGNIATEAILSDRLAGRILDLRMNDRRLLQLIREATGISPVASFFGRIFRFSAGRHRDSWHDDLGENRVLALSVNLGTTPYRGGVLQIRDEASGRIRFEHANTRPGDALIFRIAPGLRHRVTPVEGPIDRCTYAGWFRSDRRFAELLSGPGKRDRR